MKKYFFGGGGGPRAVDIYIPLQRVLDFAVLELLLAADSFKGLIIIIINNMLFDLIISLFTSNFTNYCFFLLEETETRIYRQGARF